MSPASKSSIHKQNSFKTDSWLSVFLCQKMKAGREKLEQVVLVEKNFQRESNLPERVSVAAWLDQRQVAVFVASQ